MSMNAGNTGNVAGADYAAYEADSVAAAKRKSANYGRTVGDPKLSDEGAKYYEHLKSKYSDMEFILVSDDQKEQAEANAAAYAKSGKTVVLINESKIEEMASDKEVRAKYEGIISNSRYQIKQMVENLKKSGANVKGCGMKFDDGGNAKFFAVLKKGSAAQKERIAKKAEQKKADKKAQKKKAEKEEAEERLKNKRTHDSDSDTVTIYANSVEELMNKIGDYTFAERSDNTWTDEERMVGQSIDFKG